MGKAEAMAEKEKKEQQKREAELAHLRKDKLAQKLSLYDKEAHASGGRLRSRSRQGRQTRSARLHSKLRLSSLLPVSINWPRKSVDLHLPRRLHRWKLNAKFSWASSGPRCVQSSQHFSGRSELNHSTTQSLAPLSPVQIVGDLSCH